MAQAVHDEHAQGDAGTKELADGAVLPQPNEGARTRMDQQRVKVSPFW